MLAYTGNTKEILNTIEGYSRHRPRRKRFLRRLTFVPTINHTLFADLIGKMKLVYTFRLYLLLRLP